VHQLLFIKRHTPPPLSLPDAAVQSCRCIVKPDRCILSLFSHDTKKHRILQFFRSCWSDSLERSSSSMFSSDCTFANRTEGRGGLFFRPLWRSFIRVPALSYTAFFFSESRGLGPGLGEEYVLRIWLVEVEIFIQIEVSDHCSDVQKLFSVIGNDGRNIMYKKKFRSVHKNTQNSRIRQEPIKWLLSIAEPFLTRERREWEIEKER
jgi:hypothetical protein